MTKGTCICGEIQYEINITGDPPQTVLCHCRSCQSWSGGICSLNLVIPTSAFTLTKGTPKCFNKPGDSGKTVSRHFCPECGTSLYTKGEVLPGLIILKPSSLEGEEGRKLCENVGSEIYVKDRFGFVKAVEGVGQKEMM